jgi:hypothetical protein
MCIQIVIFWVVAPCRLMGVYEYFGGPCCLTLQDYMKLFISQKLQTWQLCETFMLCPTNLTQPKSVFKL